MGKLIALNKPYGVICQFSEHSHHPTLKSCINVPHIYPAGRLDTDSEGLLLLTDDGKLQHALSHPKRHVEKTYWAQLEGSPDEAQLSALTRPMPLGKGFIAKPAKIRLLSPEDTALLWLRQPPIRSRQTVPDFWLEIRISEGKNRQVRRMSAKAGYPCLRLIRVAIGEINLFDLNLAPSQWQAIPYPSLHFR